MRETWLWTSSPVIFVWFSTLLFYDISIRKTKMMFSGPNYSPQLKTCWLRWWRKNSSQYLRKGWTWKSKHVKVNNVFGVLRTVCIPTDGTNFFVPNRTLFYLKKSFVWDRDERSRPKSYGEWRTWVSWYVKNNNNFPNSPTSRNITQVKYQKDIRSAAPYI